MIKAGTKITCPMGHEIGKLIRDIQPFDTLSVSVISFSAGQDFRPGDPAKCGHCGAWFFLMGSLHTENGWVNA